MAKSNNRPIIIVLLMLSVLIVSGCISRCEVECRDLGCEYRYQCVRDGKGTDRITGDRRMSTHWVITGFCDEVNRFERCGCDCTEKE